MARRKKGRGRPASLPPTLDGRVVVRLPRQHRQDAVQEAWVAHLEKRDPNLAVWAYLKRTRREELRCAPFSQIDPEDAKKWGLEPAD